MNLTARLTGERKACLWEASIKRVAIVKVVENKDISNRL